MDALLHSLHIGTLATWLSVVGFGAVGVIVPQRQSVSWVPKFEETRLLDDDFILGGTEAPAVRENAAGIASTEDQPESLSAPPAMAPLADLAPLPDLPASSAMLPQTPKPPKTTGRRSPAEAASDSGNKAKPTASGQSGSRNSGVAGSSMSNATRLAAGRMPSPSYPAEARRKGQTGTVTVEFTVDSSGRVISAIAKSPSPWPLLNEEAVRTVRRWSFPPGRVMKLQRPIVFQLR